MAKEYTDLELAKLAGTLKDVFETAVQSSEELQATIIEASQDQAELMAEVQELTAEYLGKVMPMAFTHSEEEIFEELKEESFTVLDKTFEFAVAACGLEAIQDYVPHSARNEAAVEGFTRNNAPTLAKIYAPA
jgi:hypothetical protein